MNLDPSVRHVLKLAEVPNDDELVYRCLLCGERGTREQLAAEECPTRIGSQHRIARTDSSAA
jgi:hypothetical protein